MSDRLKIANSIVKLVNDNLNGETFNSNIYNNAKNKLRFWDEIKNFPYIGVIAGDEYREYLPSDFTWGHLLVNINIYVRTPEPLACLENFIVDVETLLNANNKLKYDTDKTTEEIRILSIVTDEGILNTIGVGEIQIQIRYLKR